MTDPGAFPFDDTGWFGSPLAIGSRAREALAMIAIGGSRTSWLKRLVHMWIAVAVVLLVSLGGTAAQPKSGETAAQPKKFFVVQVSPSAGVKPVYDDSERVKLTL